MNCKKTAKVVGRANGFWSAWQFAGEGEAGLAKLPAGSYWTAISPTSSTRWWRRWRGSASSCGDRWWWSGATGRETSLLASLIPFQILDSWSASSIDLWIFFCSQPVRAIWSKAQSPALLKVMEKVATLSPETALLLEQLKVDPSAWAATWLFNRLCSISWTCYRLQFGLFARLLQAAASLCGMGIEGVKKMEELVPKMTRELTEHSRWRDKELDCNPWSIDEFLFRSLVRSVFS